MASSMIIISDEAEHGNSAQMLKILIDSYYKNNPENAKRIHFSFSLFVCKWQLLIFPPKHAYEYAK